jgi:hypothetical protein
MPLTERDWSRENKIIEEYLKGKTLRSIGEEHGLSYQRIEQIIKRNNINKKSGGHFLKCKIKKEEKERVRDDRYIKRYGCDYKTYRDLLNLKDGNGNNPQRCYKSQKSAARYRKIEFNLKFFEWWELWQESGKWEKRGLHVGQYVMCRYFDEGAYSKDNVYIATYSENIVSVRTGKYRLKDNKQPV